MRRNKVGTFWCATSWEDQEVPRADRATGSNWGQGSTDLFVLQREWQMGAVRKWCHRWCVRAQSEGLQIHLLQAFHWSRRVWLTQNHNYKGSELPSQNHALRFRSTNGRTLTSFMMQWPNIWMRPEILSKVWVHGPEGGNLWAAICQAELEKTSQKLTVP